MALTYPLQVAVRIRPWTDKESVRVIDTSAPKPFFLGDGNYQAAPPVLTGNGLTNMINVLDHRTIEFDRPNPADLVKRGIPGRKRYKDKRYTFDHIFDQDATQEQVFDNTAKPLLDGILDGYNATIFAYGATGCGKTHTVSGKPDDEGIIVRTMSELFRRVAESQDQFTTAISLSYVEIYNEIIRDLLPEVYVADSTGGLKLLETNPKGLDPGKVTLEGLKWHEPENVEQVMNLVLTGNERRSCSPTHANAESSRSHAVLRINVIRTLKTMSVDLASETVNQAAAGATLSIIDLAGSERAAATQNMGKRMKEGANINKSLLALSNCLQALAQRGARAHIPYRDSKLTRMLKFALGGNCRTVMIVCVSPSSEHIEDTHNTLMWANTSKNLRTSATRNTGVQMVGVQQYLLKIAACEAMIAHLESQLAAKGEASNKIEEARLRGVRDEAERHLEMLRQKVADRLPDLLSGAVDRAGWDGAELRNAVYKARLAVLDSIEPPLAKDLAQERDKLRSLIQTEDGAFKYNPQVQTRLRLEVDQAKSMEKVLRMAAEQTYDRLDEPSHRNVILSVKLHQAENAAAIAHARETAYRRAVSQQAQVVTAQVGVTARLEAVVRDQVSDLEKVLQTSGDDGPLSSAVRRAIHGLLGATGNTSSQITSPVRLNLPAVPSVRSSPSVRVSPAGRRVVSAPTGPKSPKSPKSPAHRPTRPPKKTFRWADEAGEGKIDDNSLSRTPPLSDEGWEDENSISFPAPRPKATAPIPEATPIIPLNITLPPLVIAPVKKAAVMALPSASTGWRENRAAMKSRLETLDEKSSPLKESSQSNHPAPPAMTSRLSTLGSYAKPTISSSRSAVGLTSSPSSIPIANRRLSTVGPMRLERKKPRDSLNPLNRSTSGSNPLSGGARRLVQEPVARRTSLAPLPRGSSVGLGGPRQSRTGWLG